MNCPVEIVTDIFGENNRLAELVAGRKVLLVADTNVVQQTKGLGTRIGAYVTKHGIELAGSPVVLGAGGERNKMDNFHTAGRIAAAVVESGLGEDDVLLALGGGTVLDVAGWVAAQVFGGVKLIRVPTTPAAMFGGAFATVATLNLPSTKDALELQSEPMAVLIDPEFAKTVLDGVWRAGVSEAVSLFLEHGDFAAIKEFLPLATQYAARDFNALLELLKKTLALQLEKGSSDFGRELAADLEPKSGWRLPHGYALAIGLLVELREAVIAGEVEKENLALTIELLEKSGALDGARHSKHILPPELADFW